MYAPTGKVPDGSSASQCVSKAETFVGKEMVTPSWPLLPKLEMISGPFVAARNIVALPFPVLVTPWKTRLTGGGGAPEVVIHTASPTFKAGLVEPRVTG